MADPIVITVDSRIRVPSAALSDDAARELRLACEHKNPAFAQLRALGKSTWGTPPIVRTWRREGADLTLPRGATGRLRDVMRVAGVEVRFRDRRTTGGAVMRPLAYVGHPLRPCQAAAAVAALARHQGIVRAATGSGKTTTVLYLAAAVGCCALVVVPNKGLLRQTVRGAEKLLGLGERDVGVLGDGQRRIRTLTVATQQTLWRLGPDDEVWTTFGALFVDEAHHAAARTFGEPIDRFAARYRVAFTADERRKDRMDFLVRDAFGDVLHETTRNEAERQRAIVDVEVRIVPTEFEAPWYAGARSDPASFGKLVDEMTADEARNELILAIARDEVGAGEQAIVLTHRRDHAVGLDRALVSRGVSSGLMLGSTAADQREFERTLEGLLDRSKDTGVGTYEALGEGIDLPAVAAGVAATPMWTNEQRFNQVRGRLCRPGKEVGRLYVPFDRRVFGARELNNILRWNRSVVIRRAGVWVDARGADVRRWLVSGR